MVPDLTSWTIAPAAIPLPGGVFGTVVGRSQDNSVSVIDVPRRRCIPGSFPVSQPVSVAVTPDGSTWVAASATDGLVIL